MADAFRERTARLLTDYLEYCAREPGTAARQPSSPEAAVLRCVAAQIREYNVRTLSVYRGFRWNRVELVAWMAQKLLASPRGPNWYRVASLLTFAGMLLERHPREACGRKKKEGNVSRDCRLLVALLCAQLSGQHRTWLLANGGWVSVGTGGWWAAQDAPTWLVPGGIPWGYSVSGPAFSSPGSQLSKPA